MTFRLDESVLGFGEGEMSFADPYLEPVQKTTRARIAVPRPDDFEMDPHCQWDDIEEEEDEEEKDTHQNQDHLDAVSPPPLTNNSQLFTQLQLQSPSSPDGSHLTPRGRNPSATVASRSPSSRSTSTGSRQHRMEEIHESRISSRRRHSTETESPKKHGNSLSPHHRLSRRHLLQEQRAQGQDWVASSNRRQSEPSRRNIRLAALELSGALASQETSPTGSSRRSCDPPPVPLERAESSPASLKASHHRRTSSRASSRRNLTVSPRPEVQDLPPSHREASSSRRKPLDRSSSDGQAAVRKSVAGTSSRILVTPSKSDTRTYNHGTRKTVTRSCSEGSKKIPIESGRDPVALLPIHNLSPPNRAKDHVTSHGSQSPSRSRRKTSKSQPPREDSRIVERGNARTRSRSKSRRTEGSSRRERRMSSPSNGKDKPRARSKSRDASSRRHNLRSSGGRIAKANDNGDAYKILQSMLISQDADDKDNDNDNDHTWDSFEDQFGQDKNKFPSDPEGRENTTGSDMDVSSPASSSLGDFLSLSSRRGSSPGLPLVGAGVPQSPYVWSNQATKERKEESKLRRSNIMKSLKDLLQFDAENLKVEVLEDGTKRLVVDLSDLNTVMEDFANHRK